MSNWIGAFLLNKPKGVTSFEALSSLKRAFPKTKIGHTGTLDKFASGLLVVLIGNFTRLNSLLVNCDKEYEALIQFGETTETLDSYGRVCEIGRVPTLKEIENILSNFKGKISQEPPAYSAIHIEGERAYKRILKGEKFLIPKREIEIYDLKILSYEAPLLKIQVSCSKGTYVRALARDIAYQLETVAYTRELKRIRVGKFNISQSHLPFEVAVDKLIQPREFLNFLEIDSIITKHSDCYQKGQSLQGDWFQKEITYSPKGEKLLGIYDKKDHFISLVAFQENKWKYCFVNPH